MQKENPDHTRSFIACTLHRLFLWLRQAPPVLQTQWLWRKWQTARPSWRGAPAETTAAPLPITSFKPELLSLWAGRGLTQVLVEDEFSISNHMIVSSYNSKISIENSFLYPSSLTQKIRIKIWGKTAVLWFNYAHLNNSAVKINWLPPLLCFCKVYSQTLKSH